MSPKRKQSLMKDEKPWFMILAVVFIAIELYFYMIGDFGTVAALSIIAQLLILRVAQI